MTKTDVLKRVDEIVMEVEKDFENPYYHAGGKTLCEVVAERLKAENNPAFEKYIYGYSHREAMVLADKYGLLSAEELREDGEEEPERLAEEIKTYLSFWFEKGARK